jgi:hypothetical protein
MKHIFHEKDMLFLSIISRREIKNRVYSFSGIRALAEGTCARKTIHPVFDPKSRRKETKKALSFEKAF